VIGGRILQRLIDYFNALGEEMINTAADLTETNDDHVWDTAHETNYQNQKRQEQDKEK
jgi:hypothetical protein